MTREVIVSSTEGDPDLQQKLNLMMCRRKK